MNFGAIDIMGGIVADPTLLGMGQDYQKYGVIELKKKIMTFEADGMKVTQSLDLHQGP